MANSAKPDAGASLVQSQHAIVPDQPVSVTELSPLILTRYSVRDGSVKIAGCSIDDVPFFEFRAHDAPQDPPSVAHAGASDAVEPQFADSAGKVLPFDLAESLGLPLAENVDRLPATIRRSVFKHYLHSAEKGLADGFRPARVSIERVIWCKKAVGKIGITKGDSRAQIAFQGWTRRLINGLDTLPPFQCPHTGKTSYHVVADDDQRLTVPEAIKTCGVSGRAVVETFLQTSAFSGAIALPEYFQRCAVSGESLLATELVSCSHCLQLVSPNQKLKTRCAGCVKIPRADKQLLESYRDVLPADGGFKSACIKESFSCVHVSYSVGWTRHLLVLERETRESRVHKSKGGWFRKWEEVTE